MSKLEQFGLVTGILGLVADAIALIAFFGGLWNTAPQGTSNNAGLPVLAQVIMVLVAIYGWFIIGLVLLRRRLAHRADEPIVTTEMAGNAALGVGILVAPILIGLFVAIAQTNIESRTEELRENSIIHATQTAQAYQSTVTANPATPVSWEYQPKTVAELVEREKSYSMTGYVGLGLLLVFVLFLGMWASLYALTPLIYPEVNYEEEESTPATQPSPTRSTRRNR